MGDGVTALFGLEVEAKEANRQALSAAAQVQRRIQALRDRLAQELGWTADFVIHVHTGSPVSAKPATTRLAHWRR
jgi:adenylate cyclase